MKDFATGVLAGAVIGGVIVAVATQKTVHHFIEIRGPRITLKSSRTPEYMHHVGHGMHGFPKHHMGHMHGNHIHHGDNVCPNCGRKLHSHNLHKDVE